MMSDPRKISDSKKVCDPKKICEEFSDPPKTYCPVPFWFLNERLEKERLEWQVSEMNDKHVYGAIMHPRPGLVTEYLSEDWFAGIGHIVGKAAELSMFMWLYDEYPWMSGMAEWRVPRLHDDYRIRALDRLEKVVDGPGDFSWDVGREMPGDAGRLVAVLLCPIYPDRALGPAEVIPLSDVAALPQEIPAQRDVPLSRIDPQAPQGEAGRSSSQNAGARSAARRGVRIDIKVPTGKHLLGVYFERYSYNCYGDKFGTAPVTDLMNPAAVDAFIRLTHREYEKRFPEYLGGVIQATFTDEPPSDTPGWSRALPEEFRIRKGYDLIPHLAALFHGPEQGDYPEALAGSLERMSGQVRHDYGDVVSQLYEENFLARLEAWSDRCGIASTGHLLLEETLLFHARYMGDFFRCQRRLHYPGIDYIFPGEIPAVTCKLAASVAHLYGKERVISECFALTGWGFEPARMKWMTDWQIVNGIDLIVPHAFFYSITEEEAIPPMEENLGFRWFDCPPSMFTQQPYWDYYGRYADYVRRVCYLITRGRHECCIALYYPIESVQADFIPTAEHCDLHTFKLPGTWMTPGYRWDGTSMEKTDTHFRAAANMLRDAGLDFDIVDDDSLRDATVENGALVMRRGGRYRAVILPRTEWISAEVYGRIAELHSQGGIIVATGSAPKFAGNGASRDHEVRTLSAQIFGMSPEQAAAGLDGGDPSLGGPGSENPSATIYRRPEPGLASFLRGRGLWDFASDQPGIYAQHRRIGAVDAYFLSHHEREEGKVAHIRLKGSGVPVILDPWDGEAYRPGRWDRDGDCIMMDCAFEPNEAFFVLIGSAEDLPAASSERLDSRRLSVDRALELDWKLTLDEGDAHPMRMRDMPKYPRFEELNTDLVLESLRPWEDIGLAGFSGGGTYEADFAWEGEADGDIHIDLGDVGVAAEVFLNGTSCGVRMWKPYRYPMAGAIRKGENRLRIRVVNTLANAIQETYGRGKVPTEASEELVQRFARFGEGELRSGLLGPVQILAARE